MAKASDKFLEELDAIGIIESHIQSVLNLENREAKKLLRIYNRVRHELRDRLDTFQVDKFQAQQLRGVLAQVESAIVVLQKEIEGSITKAAFDAALQGVEHTVAEIMVFEKEFRGAVQEVRIDQVLVAESTRALKLLQYQSSIDRYGRDLIDRMNRILVDAVIIEKPYAEVVRQIAGSAGFMAREAYRSERIVRTELHSVYDLTRWEGLKTIQKEVIPDLKKISIDPLDHRTALDSIAVKGQIRKITEPFQFKGTVTDPRDGEPHYVEVKPFMNHPNRPNDRGVTAPYRKSWESNVS